MGLFGKMFGSEGNKQDSSMQHSMGQHGSASASTSVKDPVCGMNVDVNNAAAKSTYQGKTYYFCAPGCKTQFEKNPALYISGQGESGHSHGGGHGQGHGCC